MKQTKEVVKASLFILAGYSVCIINNSNLPILARLGLILLTGIVFTILVILVTRK